MAHTFSVHSFEEKLEYRFPEIQCPLLQLVHFWFLSWVNLLHVPVLVLLCYVVPPFASVRRGEDALIYGILGIIPNVALKTRTYLLIGLGVRGLVAKSGL